MKLNMKWILVVLVVVIVILAYFAFVGTSEATDDVNKPQDDPTGGERLPTAYGIIHASLTLDNAVGRYTGDVSSVYCTVNDYVSFDEGRMFQNQKWDILGLFSDDMSAWVEVQITGPGQFVFVWESEHAEFSLSEWGHKTIDFTSGRCFFWDKGEYTLSVKGFADGDSGKFQVDTSVTEFSVNI